MYPCGTFLVLWFFCVVTNLCSCGDWSSQFGKLFLHEQIQHFISEISLYPQLCIALIHFWDIPSDFYNLSLIITPAFFLILVYATRVITIVKLHRSLKVVYKRLLFTVIGNYFLTAILLVVLLLYPHDFANGDNQIQMIPQLTISAYILIGNTWNMISFYSSHLYVFSLQSAFATQKHSSAIGLIAMEPFHKNMYAMSLCLHRTLHFFWLMPFGITCIIISLRIITCIIILLNLPACLSVQKTHVCLAIWMSLVVLGNAKTAAVCFMSQSTLVFILMLTVFIFFVDIIIFGFIYGPIFFGIFFIVFIHFGDGILTHFFWANKYISMKQPLEVPIG
mgnify:CR=1 FL=1